ncbi:MAG: DMT family protein [Lentisphaerae bacterium]|nr:DMT family protein [Lentisphaerota bacterium]
MSVVLQTTILLVISNTFMTFAWYAHLQNMAHKPWLMAALVSWGIALCEYLFQVPANRIGYSALSLSQLKIMQEVIALTVFIPFAIFYMRQSWSWNYIWAALCLLGAVFFIFTVPGKPISEPPSIVRSEPLAQPLR